MFLKLKSSDRMDSIDLNLIPAEALQNVLFYGLIAFSGF